MLNVIHQMDERRRPEAPSGRTMATLKRTIPWRTPRACDDYWSEFRHCKSLQNRFHHYYTYGSFPSCQQWKEDYNNCREWEKNRGPEAQAALRSSERKRVEEQTKFTPVWDMRREPPRDWHLPLNQEKPQDT